MTHQMTSFLCDPRDEPVLSLKNETLALNHIATLMGAEAERAVLNGAPDEARLALARCVFREAGMAAVAQFYENDGWVQLGLSPCPGMRAALYREVEKLLARLRGRLQVRAAFFMHKPPGLRLRVQAALTDAGALGFEMADAARGWREAGLVSDVREEIYEPETTLFGGAGSMRHVHGLFSEDSGFWLAHHARPEQGERTLEVALILLRYVFSGLGVVDWEDIDVWEKVRSRTGRAFPAGFDADGSALGEVGATILRLWSEPGGVLRALDARTRARTERAGARLVKLAADWKAECFDAGRAGTGVRSAAALYTIFFFNRAGLPLERQIIVAETLASRQVME